MLLSLHAFEEEVVGFLPSLAASEVGGEAGKWAKVQFNYALFTSHVLCHEKDRGVGKASMLQATFLIER